jgi:E3 ubiquitin-protein ligase UBR1
VKLTNRTTTMVLRRSSLAEQQLCKELRDLGGRRNNRYDDEARDELLETLFSSLSGRMSGRADYMSMLFPQGGPVNGRWNLSQAQGAIDGAEYSEGARGKACGHIFKSGEATYRCK